MSNDSKGLSDRRKYNLIGKRFGRLVVSAKSHSNNGVHWKCDCDCGGRNVVRTAILRNGSVRSCGCGSQEAAINNLHTSAEKRRVRVPHARKLKDIRRNMINRCADPRNKRWKNYGGRGITVCDEWVFNPRGFYQWATDNGYTPGLSIDRIDVNGNYEPGNCRFTDTYAQQNNTTRNHRVVWKGESKTIAEIAREIGMKQGVLGKRVRSGWSIERATQQSVRSVTR